MKLAIPCPDSACIQRYLGIGSATDDDDALEQHLVTCSACAERLREYLGADPLLWLAQRGQSLGDTPAGLSERAAALWSSGSPTTLDALGTAAQRASSELDIAMLLRPAQRPEEIGRLGGFCVLSVLGRGGMGVVCRAEDEKLGRPVALKLMRVELLGNAEARRRFLAEARAMAAVEHDHVVAVHHVGEDGVPFLVMPLLRGETLEARLKRERSVGNAEAVRVAREMALGLAAAHAKGLIHRDVKPGNVWLEEGSGRVKILDFGLARLTTADSESGASVVVGTPAYMAPEQANGEKPDGRSDLFGLGCVLYRMLTGIGPFDRGTLAAVLAAVQTAHPEPPRVLNPSVPAALSDLTMRLLSKKREERPASAAEVVTMLAEPTRWTTPRVPARRWATLVAGVLVLGAALVAWMVHGTLSDRNAVVAVNGTGASDPIPLKDGDPLSSFALIRRPQKIAGLLSWTVETKTPRGRIFAAAFRPKSTELVTLGEDGLLRFWDARKGKLLRALAVPGNRPELRRVGRGGMSPWSAPIAWTPDGKTLTLGLYDGTVFRIDAETGRSATLLEGVGEIDGLAWSPSGKVLAVALRGNPEHQGRVLLYDVAKDERDYGRTLTPGDLAFSPDGKRLGIGAAVVDVSGKPKVQKLDNFWRPSLAWSTDSKRLALADRSGVRIWAGGEPEFVERGPAQLVRWLNDERLLALGGNVRTIDISTQKVTRRTDLVEYDDKSSDNPTALLALSPDGRIVVGTQAESSALLVWDVETGKQEQAISGSRWAAQWSTSPDGKRIAVLGDKPDDLLLYETGSGKLLQESRGGGARLHRPWSPEGNELLVGGVIYDGHTLKRIADVWATEAHWGPSQDWFGYYNAHVKEGIRIFDRCLGKNRFTFQEGRPPFFFSRDGKKIAYRVDTPQVVRVRDLEGKEKPLDLAPSDRGVLEIVGFWPDNSAVILRSQYMSQADFVIDARSGKKLRELDNFLCARTFSPDGKRTAVVQLGGDISIRTADEDWKEVSKFAVPPNPYVSMFGLTTQPNLPCWAGNDVVFASGGGPNVFAFDAARGEARGVFVPLGRSRALVVGATGHIAGSRDVAQEVVYIVQTKEGQKTLTSAEFAQIYGWKNQPNQVRLLPE